MRLKVLAEGSTKLQRFIKHWGLSLVVDDDILFDTFGQPGYVLQQMKRFHIDPLSVRDIVISHDDWDHITGLPGILKLGNDHTVYVCPNSRPEVKAMIKTYGERIIEVDTPLELRRNIYISGELKGGSRRGAALPEQYMVIKTPKGLVVLTGCAHPGIIHIVKHAKKSFDSEVRLLMGGFHLKDNSDEVNAGIVSTLKELGVRQVIPLHCTGTCAKRMFRRVYGDDCIVSGEGQTVEI